MSKDITGFITWIRSFLDDVYAPKGQSGGITLDDVYPVGSIYMSVNNVNPSTLFGGTWTKIEGRFLLASGELPLTPTTFIEFTNGSTGGELEHTLTLNEIPSHNHSANLDIRFLKNAATASSSNHVTGWSNHYDTRVPNASANKGGGKAHNNMPPYLVVNVWKRTA